MNTSSEPAAIDSSMKGGFVAYIATVLMLAMPLAAGYFLMKPVPMPSQHAEVMK